MSTTSCKCGCGRTFIREKGSCQRYATIPCRRRQEVKNRPTDVGYNSKHASEIADADEIHTSTLMRLAATEQSNLALVAACLRIHRRRT